LKFPQIPAENSAIPGNSRGNSCDGEFPGMGIPVALDKIYNHFDAFILGAINFHSRRIWYEKIGAEKRRRKPVPENWVMLLCAVRTAQSNNASRAITVLLSYW